MHSQTPEDKARLAKMETEKDSNIAPKRMIIGQGSAASVAAVLGGITDAAAQMDAKRLDIEAGTEENIAAKATAPRVTPDDLDAEITDSQFHVFSGSCLTVCCLTLRNGYTVTGESACASPENFDPDIGTAVAYKNAREKIWGLLGFRLKDALHAAGQL